MSINPLSHVSQIWSRATTALINTPAAGSALASSGAGQTGHGSSPAVPPSDDQDQSVSATTPFAALASNLQAVLLQLQAGQGASAAVAKPYANPAASSAPASGAVSTLA